MTPEELERFKKKVIDDYNYTDRPETKYLESVIENVSNGFRASLFYCEEIFSVTGRTVQEVKILLQEDVERYLISNGLINNYLYLFKYDFKFNQPTIYDKIRCFVGIHKYVTANNLFSVNRWKMYKKFPFIHKQGRFEHFSVCIFCHKKKSEYDEVKIKQEFGEIALNWATERLNSEKGCV